MKDKLIIAGVLGFDDYGFLITDDNPYRPLEIDVSEFIGIHYEDTENRTNKVYRITIEEIE